MLKINKKYKKSSTQTYAYLFKDLKYGDMFTTEKPYYNDELTRIHVHIYIKAAIYDNVQKTYYAICLSDWSIVPLSDMTQVWKYDADIPINIDMTKFVKEYTVEEENT